MPPTEEDIYQIVTALGNDGVLTCRRIAAAVHDLCEGKSVDEVLKADLEKAS